MTMIQNDTLVAVADAVDAAANGTASQLSLWQLCTEGGWLMLPLLLLSIVCIYILVERCMAIKRANSNDSSFMDRVKEYVHSGNLEAAQRMCRKADTPEARLIEKGLSRIGRPMNDVLVAIENTGNIEVARLEKGLAWLATTAAGAPMIGFLGTVIGMVKAFYNIASSGSSAGIATFADGIYTALVTTVAGLIVGIVALFAYNYLVSRIGAVMTNLETKTMEFMDILNEPS